MTIWAILPAAGIGLRMGSNTPKQYLPINGVPVISICLDKLSSVSAIEKIVVVLHPQDSHWSELNIGSDKSLLVAEGGDQRHQSVLNGLQHIQSQAEDDDWVLVHDAVRPCVRSSDIGNMINRLKNHPVGGLLGTPVDNTLKQVNEKVVVQSTVDRNSYWNALTPQMFRYGLLKKAMEKVIAEKHNVTDESAAMELLGYQPQIIEGSKDNIKLTRSIDLILASKILEIQASTS